MNESVFPPPHLGKHQQQQLLQEQGRMDEASSCEQKKTGEMLNGLSAECVVGEGKNST